MNVFITGMTGTLGSELALLHASRGDRVFGCCQSESGAVGWEERHAGVATKLYSRDAMDIGKMLAELADEGRQIDRLYHVAALKHVDRCEEMADYAARQNIAVTAEVANVCRTFRIPFVLADTDKSCVPSGVYGATKLVAPSDCAAGRRRGSTARKPDRV